MARVCLLSLFLWRWQGWTTLVPSNLGKWYWGTRAQCININALLTINYVLPRKPCHYDPWAGGSYRRLWSAVTQILQFTWVLAERGIFRNRRTQGDVVAEAANHKQLLPENFHEGIAPLVSTFISSEYYENSRSRRDSRLVAICCRCC